MRRPWTEEETATLFAMAGKFSDSWIAHKLHRSECSVRRQRQKWGLDGRPRGRPVTREVRT
jgi:hypothetical protein